MTIRSSRFKFASAPNSWGVLDYPSPSWDQSYQRMLDEMVSAGYTGTELGPYGFLPTDAKVLEGEFSKRQLKLLGSFVPVVLSDPASTKVVVDQIRIVGGLLAALGAPFLVLADAQSDARDRIAGRVPKDGSQGLTPQQWKQVAKVVAEADQVAEEFGLNLVSIRTLRLMWRRPKRQSNSSTPLPPQRLDFAWTPGIALTREGIPPRKQRSTARFSSSSISRMSTIT
jgi:hypothetical protein